MDRPGGCHGGGCRRGAGGGLEGVQAGCEVAAQGRRHDRPDRGRVVEAAELRVSDVAKREARRGRVTSFAGGLWNVAIYDMAQAVGEKRGAQVALIFDRLLPKGYIRESFAGKKPRHSMRRGSPSSRGSSRRACRELGDPGRLARDRPGRQGRSSRRGFGVKRARQARRGGRGHALHDRVEHEGADDAAAREARRAGKDDVGHAGHEPFAVLQARRRGDDEEGAGPAPDLRLHRPAAAGHRVALRVPERHSRKGDGHARRPCSRRASSASCSSTRTPWPPPPGSSAGTCSIRTWSSARRTTGRCRRRCSTRSA